MTIASISRDVLPMNFKPTNCSSESNVQRTMMRWTRRTSSKISPCLSIIFGGPPQ
jgi:hypothetical protein